MLFTNRTFVIAVDADVEEMKYMFLRYDFVFAMKKKNGSIDEISILYMERPFQRQPDRHAIWAANCLRYMCDRSREPPAMNPPGVCWSLRSIAAALNRRHSHRPPCLHILRRVTFYLKGSSIFYVAFFIG